MTHTMKVRARIRAIAIALMTILVTASVAHAQAQTQPQGEKPFEPQVGQPGKDVVWVPSPEGTVNVMLDVAQLTPQDYVVDLGSGDGRNIIAAAKRGARGL